VTRRLTHELELLGKRIHILEGFSKVFDALELPYKALLTSNDAALNLLGYPREEIPSD
jgi:DNA gyrase/topoisomerase IV subunit A